MTAEGQACTSFHSLIERVESKHKVKLLKHRKRDCETEREELQTEFTEAFEAIATLYDNLGAEIAANKSICLSAATYSYKLAVEGEGGIDEKIQDAARQIHEAQQNIARLEPQLHDVEHAVTRMRRYEDTLRNTCTLDDVIEDNLQKVKRLILELQECPGRNDFTIDIPLVAREPDHPEPDSLAPEPEGPVRS